MRTVDGHFEPEIAEVDPGCYTYCCNCGAYTRTMIALAHFPTLCTPCTESRLSVSGLTPDTECDRCTATATVVELVLHTTWIETVNVCADCVGEGE